MNGLFKGVYHSQGAKFIATMYVNAKKQVAKSSLYDSGPIPSQESTYLWQKNDCYKFSPNLKPHCIIVEDYDDPWNENFFNGANRSEIVSFRGIPSYKYEKYGTTQVVDANTGIILGVNETIVDLNMEFEYYPMDQDSLDQMIQLDEDFAKSCQRMGLMGVANENVHSDKTSNVMVEKMRELEKRKKGFLRFLFPL